MRLEEQQRRNHGDKNTDEQHCHFFNGAPGKVVLSTYVLLGGLKRQKRRRQNHRNLNQRGIAQTDTAENVDSQHVARSILKQGHTGQYTGEHHRQHDHQHENNVVCAAQAQFCTTAQGLAPCRQVFSVRPLIHHEINGQQHHHV